MTVEELLNNIDEQEEPVTITMTYRNFKDKDLLTTVQIGNIKNVENIAISKSVLAEATRILIQRIIDNNL